MIDWTGLPYFLAVAKTGSLRAAADAVGATHATVNRQVQSLETSYGVRLFDRTRQGLTLTDAGEALVPLAEAAEQSVLAARARMQGVDREAHGLVRVSIPPLIAFDVLAPMFAEFATQYPEIELQISITNRMEDINRLETDVSIRIAKQVSEDVVCRKVMDVGYGVYASEDYLRRNFENRGPNGEGLTWIGWGEIAENPEWLRNSPFPKARIYHAIKGVVMQTRMARQGIGMIFMPTLIEHYGPELRRVPGVELNSERSLYILLHSDLRRTKRVRVFVDFMVEKLRAERERLI
ncbi:MAG: LysR family transcriptional regulator [Pseudoruegeria sp.]